MKIIKDDIIRNKWHSGFTRYFSPTEIVIHGTAGGNTYQYVLNGERAAEYVNGIALFHYLIELDGSIYELIDPERWVYHSSSGRHDARTIGIELLNLDKKNEIAYNALQYLSVYELILELTERYDIKYITSHARNSRHYSNIDKHCPGNFDWEDLERWLTDANFKFKKLEYDYFKLEGRNEES